MPIGLEINKPRACSVNMPVHWSCQGGSRFIVSSVADRPSCTDQGLMTLNVPVPNRYIGSKVPSQEDLRGECTSKEGSNWDQRTSDSDETWTCRARIKDSTNRSAQRSARSPPGGSRRSRRTSRLMARTRFTLSRLHEKHGSMKPSQRSMHVGASLLEWLRGHEACPRHDLSGTGIYSAPLTPETDHSN